MQRQNSKIAIVEHIFNAFLIMMSISSLERIFLFSSNQVKNFPM